MANIETITSEQESALKALKDSISADTKTEVKDESTKLQATIDKKDSTGVLIELQALEARLESLNAVEAHRGLLREAKLAMGGTIDDIGTRIEQGVDLVQDHVIKPVITALPGGETVLNATKPMVDKTKEYYASLPTALRLPVLGAAIGASTFLASYIVKGFGKAVGWFSPNKGQSIENAATKMEKTGITAFFGGIGIFAGMYTYGKYKDGAFDSTLESLKANPTNATEAYENDPQAAASPTADPSTGPAAPQEQPLAGVTFTHEELKSPHVIDGKTVQLLDGPVLEVNGNKWNMTLPSAASFKDARMENGSLIINASIGFVPVGETPVPPAGVISLLNTLASSTNQQEVLEGVTFDKVV